eukprot:s43_g20.t1
MVTETNLETGRPREHQVEFFFFKLVGDWNMAQRMGNYWRQHYGLDTYPVDTPPAPPTTPTLPTDALDTPIAVAVQLIREMRNLPLATSIDEYNNQLLTLVGSSGISPRLSSVQLETLAEIATGEERTDCFASALTEWLAFVAKMLSLLGLVFEERRYLKLAIPQLAYLLVVLPISDFFAVSLEQQPKFHVIEFGVLHFVLWRAKGVAAAATAWSMAGGGGRWMVSFNELLANVAAAFGFNQPFVCKVRRNFASAGQTTMSSESVLVVWLNEIRWLGGYESHGVCRGFVGKEEAAAAKFRQRVLSWLLSVSAAKQRRLAGGFEEKGDLGQSPAVAQLVAVGVMHFVLWRAKGVAAAATAWSMAGGRWMVRCLAAKKTCLRSPWARLPMPPKAKLQ